jgi:hypothetical protein
VPWPSAAPRLAAANQELELREERLDLTMGAPAARARAAGTGVHRRQLERAPGVEVEAHVGR